VDEALPYLKRAVASCRVFDAPFAHTHAMLNVGRALESKGDHAGACEAYGKVLARWGHAKPRSVTADKARERAKALGCAP
jgi:eukaryotic-like serine/threonine-protein kinase